MTYGWAILIIAIVLVALFSLGVFNGANFAPKASPGSCQVFRPYGPGTTQDINLEGECTNQLPKYVAIFSPSGSDTAWGGGLINVSITSANNVSNSGEFTFTGWIYNTNPNIQNAGIFGDGGVWLGPYTKGFFTGVYSGGYLMGLAGDNYNGIVSTPPCCTSSYIPVDSWIFFAVTFNEASGKANLYISSKSGLVNFTNTITGQNIAPAGGAGYAIGSENVQGFNSWTGMISDIQLYNSTLSANDINSIYLEGIGGVPVDILHIVGWWPLNGNGNDYSGNNANGVATTNVLYTNDWSANYNPP